MAVRNPTPSAVKSATRTLDLIEYVAAQRDGVAAQELSAALSIPVSSLSYLLATLTARQYVERVGRRYYAGPGLERFRGLDEEQTLADRARPLLKLLRQQLNETVSLFEPVGWELTAVVTETAEQTLRYSIEVGTRTPLHCVAAGKALLAAMAPAQLGRYFAESQREKFTVHTICDPDTLLAEIETVRRSGYASTFDEYSIGVAAIGCAVRVHGIPVASLSVAIPSARYNSVLEEQVVGRVRNTALALGR